MKRLLLAAGLLAAASALFAAPPTEGDASRGLVARRAAEAYEAGEYAEARELYEFMVLLGSEGAGVHHNLGNCALKQGRLGRAILEYRRALRFDPGLDASRHNLELVRRLLPARKAPWRPPPWEVFLGSIPLAFLEGAAILLAWAGCACVWMVLFLSAGRLRKALTVTAAGLMIATAVAGGFLYFAVEVLPSHRPAVVTERAPVYPGPSEDSEPLDRLPEGTEVTEMARAGDWSLVLWGEGKGWVPADTVEVP